LFPGEEGSDRSDCKLTRGATVAGAASGENEGFSGRCQYVVTHPGVAVDSAELRDFARGVLAHFKVPTAFNFVNTLPKTATGKIQKYVLRGGRAGIAHQ
jgi:acyl-coenzyme A synthetase/AMP-(fatty) acid ligase